ncbi:MAG: hypothetical protein WD058_09635 [Dehalococcoidia bacterium]
MAQRTSINAAKDCSMMADTADPTTATLTFDDFYVLSAEDVDTFAVDWNEHPTPPPYHIVVDGKRFSYTGLTFLVRGYGAELPKWVREEEAIDHLVLFAEREGRLLAYVYDPTAEVDEEPDAIPPVPATQPVE